MKKFLLTVALILAVATSLTAGTLASYNQTINATGDVYSKKFSFSTTESQLMEGTLNLVPGSTVVYKIDVAQDMEVPVLYTVSSSLTGDNKLIDRLKKTVKLIDGNGQVVNTQDDGFTLDKVAGKEASPLKSGCLGRDRRRPVGCSG